ncbi:MAG: prepilin-type N-terminal cleavage/methylation domain-containing protein [Planctomycetota bacterium]
MQGKRPGFTLIELLAVLVLIALVSAAVAGAIMQRRGSPMQAARLLQVLDQRARIASRIDGPRVLVLGQQSDTVVILALTASDPVEEVAIRPVSLTVDGEAVERIVYDRLGQTLDYTAGFAPNGELQVTLQVAGLTGWSYIARSGVP